MEQATPIDPNTSWADESANWTKSIGDNTLQEGALNTSEKSETLFPANDTQRMSENDAQRMPGNDAQRMPGNDAYDLDLPEGVEADSELLQEFADVAQENSLPPETARKILDLQVKNVQRQMDTFMQQQSAWRNEITNDPTFGGSRLEVTVNNAKRALKTYDPDGTLLPELNRTGYGNHPGIIRFLSRVGRTMREDSVHTGREQKTDTRPLRERLWPD